MGGEGESERKREVDGEMMRLVGWAGVLGLGRFAGGAPPLPSLFPSLNCEVAAPPRRRTSSNFATEGGKGERKNECHRMLHV